MRLYAIPGKQLPLENLVLLAYAISGKFHCLYMRTHRKFTACTYVISQQTVMTFSSLRVFQDAPRGCELIYISKR